MVQAGLARHFDELARQGGDTTGSELLALRQDIADLKRQLSPPSVIKTKPTHFDLGGFKSFDPALLKVYPDLELISSDDGFEIQPVESSRRQKEQDT